MNLVYALGTGSVLKNFELRYSMRSVEKFLTGYDKVWIVGEKPDWIQNVEHIPFSDQTGAPSDTNIMKKVSRACQEPGISEDFLFMNDDHFLMEPFDAQTFPYFYHGTMAEHAKARWGDEYSRRIKRAEDHLKSIGKPTKFFDIHTPIVYNKALFLSNVTSLDWTKAYVIKSVYANSLEIEGVEEPDGKSVYPPRLPVKVYSSYPHPKAAVTRFLQEQFPKPTKYERDI